MPLPRVVVWTLSTATLVLGAGVVSGQDFPTKPIRIVVTEAGGGGDFVARLIAQGLTAGLGQQAIVDNRGGSVVTPAGIAAKAPPDGYTLLSMGNILWLLPFMQDRVPYDPVRDFSPITLTVSTPNILVVYPSMPVKSVKELVVLAKAKPGALDYASSITGTASHLAGELFKAMADVSIVRVPYKGSGPALIDLIGGRVHLMFATATSVTPHIKSGKLRALAVTTAQPYALFPQLPTVATSGLPGYESGATYGMFAPARTPETTIKRLNHEIVRFLGTTEAKEKFLNAGSQVVASPPERVAATMKSEMARMGKVIKDAGIRAD